MRNSGTARPSQQVMPVLVLLVLGLLALFVPVAHAATIESRDGCNEHSGCFVAIDYVAAPGEANDLDVVIAGGVVTFRDAGAPITGDACRPSGGDAACAIFEPSYTSIGIKTGDGDDRVRVHAAEATSSVDLGAGADVFVGDGSAFGGNGDDRLLGGRGDDALDGGPGRDVVSAGDGDDAIGIAQGGADAVDGGDGADVLDLRGSPRGVDVDLARRRFVHGVVAREVEGVVGSRFADRLAGDASANRIEGGGGADRIDARGGDDVIVLAPYARVRTRCGADEDELYVPTDERSPRPPVAVAEGCEVLVLRIGSILLPARLPLGLDRAGRFRVDVGCPERPHRRSRPCRVEARAPGDRDVAVIPRERRGTLTVRARRGAVVTIGVPGLNSAGIVLG